MLKVILKRTFKIIFTNILFIIGFFSLIHNANANKITYACEALLIDGDAYKLTNRINDKIKPSLEIDSENKTITISYLFNERKVTSVYKISKENKSNILGTENFKHTHASIIHFLKPGLTYSTAFIGDMGRTFSYGRCFK